MNKFDRLVQKHQSDRYYKTFSSWTHLLTMLFGALSRCDSMDEICDEMQGLAGKLNHLGLDSSPAKAQPQMDLENGIMNFSKKFTSCCFNISSHFCRSGACVAIYSELKDGFFFRQMQMRIMRKGLLL